MMKSAPNDVMLVLDQAKTTTHPRNTPTVNFHLLREDEAIGFVDELITNYIKEASYISRLQVAREKVPEANRRKLSDAKKEFKNLVAK